VNDANKNVAICKLAQHTNSSPKSANAEQNDAAVPVSEPAAGNERHSKRHAVSRRDKLQVAGACMKVGAKRRQTDVDDGGVQKTEERSLSEGPEEPVSATGRIQRRPN
jgi:hypothetical protein